MPAMLTPRMGQQPPVGQSWAADNGRFSAPESYTDAAFLAWLGKMPVDSCLFATAPDVVGDGAATLALSAPMFAPIRQLGYRVALVAQDGLEHLDVPWNDFDALFIGGSTGWKLSEAARELCQEAKRRGKWVHMGRVNSLRRMQVADAFGCDSADGTILRFDPNRPVHTWADQIRQAPSLWTLLLAFILAGCGTASAYPLSHWQRLPDSIFHSYVGTVAPDGPVDAGLFPSGDPIRSRGDGGATPQSPKPSILPTARPTGHASSYVAVKGVATWYAYHPGQAAAARRLRDALGPNWRGMTVRVCGPLRCLSVVLTDYESSTIPGRLIDLDSRDWAAICGPLSRGVCSVEVIR